MKTANLALCALGLGLCGCSSLQPASKYQGMEVKGVTVTLHVNELRTADASIGAAGASPAVSLELATQSAQMSGEDTHTSQQTPTTTVSPETQVR